MELNVFKKIADEVSAHPGAILRIVCDGEPMMHPDFMEIISYARSKGIRPLCLNTNGTLLDERAAKELLRQNVEVIEVSLDALSRDTYARVRIGGDFDKVVANINALLVLRRDMRSSTKIMVSIIDQPEAKAEIPGFKAYWEKRVDRVIIRQYTSIGGLIDTKGMASDAASKERWPCPLLWTRAFISVDGLMKFCIEDWLDMTLLGDVKQQSIESIWQSAAYQELRLSHMNGEFWRNSYCAKCSDWASRDWEYDYFFALNKVLGGN
jgi:MoaA/NifB/PqqE/SkfB family radical SAM enzyme